MENAAFLEPQKDDLLEAMLEFFEEHVQQRFPEEDYTFDVYITTAGKVSDTASAVPRILCVGWCAPAMFAGYSPALWLPRHITIAKFCMLLMPDMI